MNISDLSINVAFCWPAKKCWDVGTLIGRRVLSCSSVIYSKVSSIYRKVSKDCRWWYSLPEQYKRLNREDRGELHQRIKGWILRIGRRAVYSALTINYPCLQVFHADRYPGLITAPLLLLIDSFRTTFFWTFVFGPVVLAREVAMFFKERRVVHQSLDGFKKEVVLVLRGHESYDIAFSSVTHDVWKRFSNMTIVERSVTTVDDVRNAICEVNNSLQSRRIHDKHRPKFKRPHRIRLLVLAGHGDPKAITLQQEDIRAENVERLGLKQLRSGTVLVLHSCSTAKPQGTNQLNIAEHIQLAAGSKVRVYGFSASAQGSVNFCGALNSSQLSIHSQGILGRRLKAERLQYVSLREKAVVNCMDRLASSR